MVLVQHILNQTLEGPRRGVVESGKRPEALGASLSWLLLPRFCCATFMCENAKKPTRARTMPELILGVNVLFSSAAWNGAPQNICLC